MSVEQVRVRLRRKLEEMLGMDEADLLLDRPPGGWSDLATHDAVRQASLALGQRLDARIDALDRNVTSRFEAFDEKFTNRIDALDQNVTSRFEAFDEKFTSRIDALDQRFETRFDALDQKFETRFVGLDDRFSSLEHRIIGQLHREMTLQTWRLVGAMATFMAIFAAVIKA